MTSSSAAAAPAVRLRSPGEIVAAVPQLCGFVPSESLVLVSLRGRRSRVGLTVRVDLPPPQAEDALARSLVGRLAADGADAALAVVFTEDPGEAGGLPRARLADALRRCLVRRRLAPAGVLLVRDDRWWSYDCSAACCPPQGTPVDRGSDAVLLMRARAALTGRAVLGSRQDLVASLSPATAPAAVERLEHAAQVRRRRVQAEGRVAVGRDDLRLWRRAWAGVLEPPAGLGPAAGAHLVVSLHDVLVRDEVLTWALEDDEGLLSLLLQLAAAGAAPHDVPVCALVGWVAHVRGDGALANVALDRALEGDPQHALARLGRQALDGQVAPSAVRALLADARAVLHQQHPWTALRSPGDRRR